MKWRYFSVFSFFLISIFGNTEISFGAHIFSDVLDSSAYAESIEYAASHHLVEGYAHGTFRPNTRINRAEFVKILENIDPTKLGTELCPEHTNTFLDVASNQWFAPLVCNAKQKGYIDGYPDGTFHGERPLSFVEAAKTLVKFFHLEEHQGGEWYAPFAKALSEKNAIPPSVLKFDHFLTRAEVIEMVYRLRENVEGKESSFFDSEKNILTKDIQKREVYLPILMFHHVLDVPKNDPDQTYYKLSISLKKLEEFLQFFQNNGVETLTFSDLDLILKKKKILPKKSVMLTFDDGYGNNFENAFPLLEKYKMKGNFAIITGKPGTDPWYMNWGEIQQLSESGHEICSHTDQHQDLQKLSKANIATEFEKSKNILEGQLGKEILCIVYPGGKYDSRVKRIAKEKGYEFGRTTDNGAVQKFIDKFVLKTFRIFPNTATSSLKNWFADANYK